MSGSGEVYGIGIIGGGGIWGLLPKNEGRGAPVGPSVGSDQPLVELGPPLLGLDCSHRAVKLATLFLPIASAVVPALTL